MYSNIRINICECKNYTYLYYYYYILQNRVLISSLRHNERHNFAATFVFFLQLSTTAGFFVAYFCHYIKLRIHNKPYVIYWI